MDCLERPSKYVCCIFALKFIVNLCNIPSNLLNDISVHYLQLVLIWGVFQSLEPFQCFLNKWGFIHERNKVSSFN